MDGTNCTSEESRWRWLAPGVSPISNHKKPENIANKVDEDIYNVDVDPFICNNRENLSIDKRMSHLPSLFQPIYHIAARIDCPSSCVPSLGPQAVLKFWYELNMVMYSYIIINT